MELKVRNSFLLVLTAAIWGFAFVAQTQGGDLIGPYSFNCLRSFIGVAFLLLVVKGMDKLSLLKKMPKSRADWKMHIKAGFFCGVFLFLGTTLQQLSMFYGTEAGKSGFLTACYILGVPILGLFIGKRCGLNIWIGVLIMLAGLYLLCGSMEGGIKMSDLLSLACALAFSVQIMLVDHYTERVEGVIVSILQFLVTGLFSLVPMFWVDMQHSLSAMAVWYNELCQPSVWISLLYAGVLSSGVAYTLQIVAQRGINPTIASMLMSLESVFSVIGGFLFLGQVLSIKELIGCGLIFGAIILAQIPTRTEQDSFDVN